MSLEEARSRFRSERDLYDRLATRVKEELEQALRSAGVPCLVECRAKDEASLLKKLLRKGKGYDEIGDKAGARVLLSYPDDRARALVVINEQLVVLATDDKAESILPEFFGYTAVHLDVRLPVDAVLGHLRCEVQVHTPGEAAWAKLTHDLTYKTLADLSNRLKRAMARVKALTELIDSEAEMVRREISSHADASELRLLSTLERMFLPLVSAEYDRELSIHVLRYLRPSWDQGDVDERLEEFARTSRSQIEAVLSRRGELCFPLLTQPESLLIMMLVHEDAYALQTRWPPILREQWLYDLASCFGVALDDQPV